MAFLRFAVPEYDFRPFKDLSWTAPTFLSAGEIGARIKGQANEDASAHGCAAIEVDTAVFEKFNVHGGSLSIGHPFGATAMMESPPPLSASTATPSCA